MQILQQHWLTPAGDDGTIARIKMPQVDDKDIPTLISYLGSLRVGISAGLIDPSQVSAHQPIDPDKAKTIPAKWMRTPVLISKEPFVIDGNHRWYRHHIDGTLMPYIRFETSFSSCLRLIMSFPQTYEES